MDNSYTIEIEQFRGPFDLLLFFIERDELDINDIPIAKITDDFLAYLRSLEELNIDIASEFILVAASLMRIKARMLIPRKQFDSEGNEVDPREELVQKLLEYKQYKDNLTNFEELESLRSKVFKRGNTQYELKKIAVKALIDIEMESLNLYALLQTYEKLMQRFENRQQQQNKHIYLHNYQVADQRKYILNTIEKASKVSFEDLFTSMTNKIHAIVTFLALLELLNDRKLSLLQGEGVNNFWLSASK